MNLSNKKIITILIIFVITSTSVSENNISVVDNKTPVSNRNRIFNGLKNRLVCFRSYREGSNAKNVIIKTLLLRKKYYIRKIY